MRILFHVNHLWGIGHFTRTAAIAGAVADMGGEAVIIAGNTPVFARLDPRVRLVTLPAVRTPDTGYKYLVDANGGPVDEALWARRRGLIEQALADSRPDILVTETFPFGRRKLAPELLHLIAAAKSRGAAIVASVRDIPFIPSGERRIRECAGRLEAHYDAVLIHGDERLFPLGDFWPGALPVPAHYTGFVTAEPPALVPDALRRGVVVSAGGGGDAAPLLEAAMTAWEDGLLADQPWLFITGPNAPEDLFEALAPRANRRLGAEIVHAVPDLPRRLAYARLSISRGGSTLVETVAAGTRAVIVPFSADNQPEQEIRAARFAAQNLIVHLPEENLSSVALSGAVTAALAAPAPSPQAILLGGAARSATLLAQLAKRG